MFRDILFAILKERGQSADAGHLVAGSLGRPPRLGGGVSDNNGASVATNAYDAWGIPNSGNIGRFQYTGQAKGDPPLAVH